MNKIILVVDDEKDIVELVAYNLEREGYQIAKAYDGHQALRYIRENQPDLVILDLMLPGISGLEICRLIRKKPETEGLPIIMLTAKSDSVDKIMGLEIGADDYLTKPFNEEDLLNAIESRLAKTSILHDQRMNKPIVDEKDGDLHTLNDLKNFVDDHGKEFHFKKGEIIFQQGKNSNYIFLLKKGIVKTHKIDENGKELTTSLLKEDDLFGYASLLQNITYQESATAVENCDLAGIIKEELKNVLQKNHKVTLELFELLSDNLSEMKEQLLQMAYGSVRKKTAATILQFAEKMNPKKQDQIKISRNDLASVAGIATESLIRTLSHFNKEGLIEINGRNIKILDLASLKQIQ